jgi:predicted ArsR family transcriptional regulator
MHSVGSAITHHRRSPPILAELSPAERIFSRLAARFHARKAVGRQVATRLARAKERAERIRTLSGIMRELGYQSGSIDPANEKLPAIETTNCVFHSLAQRYQGVCYFDLALMSEVVGSDLIHDVCIVRGCNVCRFKFKEHP